MNYTALVVATAVTLGAASFPQNPYADERADQSAIAAQPLFVCADTRARQLAKQAPGELASDIAIAVSTLCAEVRQQVISDIRAIYGQRYQPAFADMIDRRVREMVITTIVQSR